MHYKQYKPFSGGISHIGRDCFRVEIQHEQNRTTHIMDYGVVDRSVISP